MDQKSLTKAKSGQKCNRRGRDKNTPPRPPPGAFMQFMIDRRRALDQNCIGSFQGKTNNVEISKLSDEWKNLDPQTKNTYLVNAAKLMSHYKKQMKEYKQVHKNENLKSTIVESNQIPLTSGIDIFSKQFLDYNRERESLLKRLKSEYSQLEQEIEILNADINQIRNSVMSLGVDVDSKRAYLLRIENRLQRLRKSLLPCLSSFAIPGSFCGMTADNSDDYLCKLIEAVDRSSHGHDQELSNRLKEALKNFKLQ